jgi:hypothetical protein
MPVTLMVDGESVRVMGGMSCQVESKTTPDTWHVVEFVAREDQFGRWECTCTGFTIRRSCRHARAVARWWKDEADVRFRDDPDEGE